MGIPHLPRRSFLTAVSAGAVLITAAPMLAACGGDDSGSGGKVTIEWMNIATTEPSQSLYPKIVKAFEAQNPNVTVKTTNLENEAFKSKMTALVASGDLPDIYVTWGGGVLKQQIDAGLVKDITSDGSKVLGTMTDVSKKPYQFDGKTYAVPYDMGMVGFWYNKKHFEKAGIDGPPKTWAEFMDAVRKLKDAGVTPIALGGKDKWPGHYYWSYLAMRIGGMQAMEQAAQSNDFSGAPFVQAGEKLKELSDLQPFQQGFQNAGYDTPGGQAATMGAGKAAMELMGQWAPAVQVDASGNELGDDLGWFPFPTVEGGPGAVTDVFGGGNGFAVSKDAPKEALDFLTFFMNEANEREQVTSGASMPVVKGAESALDDPNRKMVAEALNTSAGFQLYLDQAFPPAVGQEVNDSVASLIAGKKSAQEVTQAVTKVAKSQ
ncbi:extracellular solute-binding protein [Actinomadura livida]|uniref:Extracellular solute-binding protein n=1 Tax=Actinomadura livida TaxID=79909 RepID=A0A7W7IDB6_9ACTN|nr:MULTISPECIES: extracellular solute-binding protein [Actinomadura]MBB4775017.1 raffinose/stachyose/melibiose transport system substrate-binding protein [Actinomadura catellatispora]GGT87235.1 ABC transporter substrate-binding protein [Actinomadura livida]